MRRVLTVLLLGLAVAITPVAGYASGGHYAGGHGRSHKGGHYKNRATHDHYRHRKH
jgi:hypothetical protein